MKTTSACHFKFVMIQDQTFPVILSSSSIWTSCMDFKWQTSNCSIHISSRYVCTALHSKLTLNFLRCWTNFWNMWEWHCLSSEEFPIFNAEHPNTHAHICLVKASTNWLNKFPELYLGSYCTLLYDCITYKIKMYITLLDRSFKLNKKVNSESSSSSSSSFLVVLNRN